MSDPTCETCDHYTTVFAWCHHHRQAMQPDATCPRHRPRCPMTEFRRGIETACVELDALAAGLEAQVDRPAHAEAMLEWCRTVAARLRSLQG